VDVCGIKEKKTKEQDKKKEEISKFMCGPSSVAWQLIPIWLVHLQLFTVAITISTK